MNLKNVERIYYRDEGFSLRRRTRRKSAAVRQELAQSTTHSMAETGNESAVSCLEKRERLGCGGEILSVFIPHAAYPIATMTIVDLSII